MVQSREEYNAKRRKYYAKPETKVKKKAYYNSNKSEILEKRKKHGAKPETKARIKLRLQTPENIIKRFSHIQIEYHFGYLDMKKRLESYGFEVTHTSPRRANRIGTINTLVGFLYAKNKSL